MAHNIDMSNQRANIAFRGLAPWHGLGVEMPDTADIVEWRRQAGLDFKVVTAPVKFDIIHAADQPCPSVEKKIFAQKAVTYREDTGAPLGVVSAKHYKIVQPADVLEFFREFARAGDMKLEVAGSILGGRRVWALARHEMEIRVMGQDVVRPYFLLTTSFDGETATIGTFCTTRVVCNNTLNIAYREIKNDGTKGYAQAGFSIPHFQTFDMERARQHAASLIVAATQFEADANHMAEKLITGEDAMRFFVGIAGVKDKDGEDLTKNSRAKIDRMLELYRTGPGATYRSAANTAWGLLNAVTRFVDHEAKERSIGGRWIAAQYGAGKEMKAKAYREAMALAMPEAA